MKQAPVLAPRRTGQISPASLFFPMAALFAAVAPAFWLLSWLGMITLPMSPDPLRHGHEMLLGFASAVIAGFLVTKARPVLVWALAFLWLSARLGGAGLLSPLGDAAAGVGFALLLFLLAGWPFLRAVRTGHNLFFAPILALFCTAEILMRLGWSGLLPDLRPGHGLLLALDAVTALLFVMGGRLIAGLAASALRSQGLAAAHHRHLSAEWLGMAGIGLAALARVLDMDGLVPWALAAAGLAVFYRLALWRSWRLFRAVLDLRLLLLAYLWLGLGLLLPLSGLFSSQTALHAITIGALGNAAAIMMPRTLLQRRRTTHPFPALNGIAALLLSLSALARLTAPSWGSLVFLAAALLWSAAFLLLAVLLIRVLLEK
ncbi:NnrS family protein [Telmatospirillum sp. J64-1]|uniref:NnrS family protein n=1 Tax=Telmatospirillum sp. J64-1 TaxID=2502183 RepID=UPI00115D1FF7|nr:NnrS family protein [Telmatospirillum sp. J64-1]